MHGPNNGWMDGWLAYHGWDYQVGNMHWGIPYLSESAKHEHAGKAISTYDSLEYLPHTRIDSRIQNSLGGHHMSCYVIYFIFCFLCKQATNS